MYCTECSNSVPETMRFCPKCGGAEFSDKEPSSQSVGSNPGNGGSPSTESVLNASGHAQPQAVPQTTPNARFGIRLFAHIIDMVIITIGSFVVGFIFISFNPFVGEGALRIIGIALSWLYYVLMETSRWQGTVGKIWLGLKVVTDSENPVTFAHATGRFILKSILIPVTLTIICLMAAFREDRRTGYDMMSSTKVIGE
jgi:uncharacterized RDD family membrane protein YckC